AIECLQDANNEVLFVTCSGEARPCDSNPEQSVIRCWECRLSSWLLLSQIEHPNFKHRELSSFNIKGARKNHLSEFDFTSITDLKSITYNNINIGLGVVSSYVSMTRNLEPLMEKANREYFNAALKASAILVELSSNIVELYNPDLVYLFNGRYSSMRPVLEVASNRDLKTCVLECTFSSTREIQRKVKF
ncbi:hypothetical protein, partial [Noviherbaspirillum sp. ST9]